jgi:hypothetical protein
VRIPFTIAHYAFIATVTATGFVHVRPGNCTRSTSVEWSSMLRRQCSARSASVVKFASPPTHATNPKRFPSDDPRAYYKYSLIVLDTSTSDAISFSANERS